MRTLIAILLATPLYALSMQALASNAPGPTYSPYVDLTLNTHWNAQKQTMEPMDLLALTHASGVNHFRLAFITDAGHCNPAWGGQTSYTVKDAWGSGTTDQLRAHAVGYAISLGGANGEDISQSCSETQLLMRLEQIISVYQPQGLDFDIENGSANVAKLMTALQQVQKNHSQLKISFTLPVLPEGLTPSGQDVLRAASATQLRYSTNIMAMDYGPAYSADMGEYAIQAAANLFKFLKELHPASTDAALWQLVEVTPMIGVNDVNVEQFTLANADKLYQFAKKNNIGALSMWSFTRDLPCADKWASPICSGNNLQIRPYEFSQHFMKDSKLSRRD